MIYAHNGDVELYYDTFGDPADPALLLVNTRPVTGAHLPHRPCPRSCAQPRRVKIA